ncbi:hypothetical protein A3715_18190 [Oleiphilus sp. HI0009]|nr:hypothetical protein A3715_18190 [Oleiphilus sp. HI0009]
MISFKNLSFSYPKSSFKLTAEKINLDSGIYGLIGPNGSGKTTLMKGLCSEVLKLDFIPGDIAFMGVDSRLYSELTLYQHVPLYCASNNDLDNCYLYFSSQLSSYSDSIFPSTKAKQLSFGQHQLIKLLLTLSSKPSVIFLDEPTTGLDVIVKNKLSQIIKSYVNSNDAAVLLSSHDLHFLELCTDQFYYIDNQKTLFTNSVNHVFSDVSL